MTTLHLDGTDGRDLPPDVPRVEPVTTALRFLAIISTISAVVALIAFVGGLTSDDETGAIASLGLALGAMTSAALLFSIALGLDLLNGILWNVGEVAAALPDDVEASS